MKAMSKQQLADHAGVTVKTLMAGVVRSVRNWLLWG